MKIFLLRHGESEDDIEDCYGGIADFPLTEAGCKTAQELATRLSNSGIELLYSSPYKRAHETANYISKTLGCSINVVNELRERNSYGVLSGVNKAKAKEIFSGVIKVLKNKPGDYYSDELVVGAEPVDEFDKRVQKAIDEIIADAMNHELNIIGIVTHGNVTRSIYKKILAVTGKVDLELLAITVIDYQPGSIVIDSKEGIQIKP